MTPADRERLLATLDAVIAECWAAAEFDFVRELDKPRATLADAVQRDRLRAELALPLRPDAARMARQLGAEGLL